MISHVIHRHGMDEKTAFEVEAALIDAYPGLTNVAGGARSGEYGTMHATEIVAKYRARQAGARQYRQRGAANPIRYTYG